MMKSHFYGKHHTKEAKQKISKANKGSRRTEEQKQRMSELHKGKIASDETKLKMSESHKGRIRTEEHKQNLSEAMKRWCRNNPDKRKGENSPRFGKHHTAQKGEKNPSWQGGASFEPYGIEFNNELKAQVRDRDNHICQLCKTPENGRSLDVHHIDYDKKNNNPINLISLDPSCHFKTNGNREIWESVFCEYQNYRCLEVKI